MEENLSRVSDDVVSVCAANAVLRTEGVAALSGGLSNAMSLTFRRKESISKGSIKVDLLFSGKEEGITYYMIYSTPGTYSRKGNKVHARFDPDKAKFRVSNLKSEDKETKKLLKIEEFKKEMLKSLSMMIREEMGEDAKSLSYMAELFQEFTIERVSDDRLTINVDGDKLRFHRAQ